MKRLIGRFCIPSLLTLIITACAVQGGPLLQTPGQNAPTGTAAPVITLIPLASPTAPEPVEANPTPGKGTPLPEPIQAAAEALGQMLGIDPGAVEVVEYQSVEWPDASLGCPTPGMMYAQVVTPGYRVVLKVGEQSYEYHTSLSGSGVLCSEENLLNFPVTPGEIDDAVPWQPVD